MTIDSIADIFEKLAATRGDGQLFLGGQPLIVEVKVRHDGELVVSFEAGGLVLLAVTTRGE